MSYLLKNWQTTSAGLIMIIGSTVHLIFSVRAGKAEEMEWTVGLTAIVGGLGLIFAGDAKASAKEQEKATQMISVVAEQVGVNTKDIKEKVDK